MWTYSNILDRKNKKGVSVIVAYVLLVMMGLGMAVLVFNWLKYQVDLPDEVKCPNEIYLVIENVDYDCENPGDLNITIKNRGFFTFDGYVIRVNNRSEGNVAVRPNSTEPITPHWHIVARGVVDVSDKFADPSPNNDDPLKNDKWKFADPCFGNDYPLATGKLSLADSKFTKDDVEKMSHAFSQALIPEIHVQLEKMAKKGIVLPITLNLKSY